MTFDAWFRKNEAEMIKQARIRNFSFIKGLFMDAWHDGYKRGYDNAKFKLSQIEIRQKYQKDDEG